MCEEEYMGNFITALFIKPMMEFILELKTNNALSIVSVDNNAQCSGCINLG